MEGAVATDISRLPGECLSLIISLTSPRDSCRSSAVSAAFHSAAISDNVWERFLTPDLASILSRSVEPPSFASKKEIYFRLCHHPILIDGGRKSFWLERETGSKCFELGARDLSIIWGEDVRYWAWISLPESSSQFAEIAELLDVCWLDISGRIDCRELSPKTEYAAYLVFKLAESAYGLTRPAQQATVAVEGELAAPRDVFLMPRRPPGEEIAEHLPRERSDGWMEIELGEFFSGDEEGGEVVMRLAQVKVLNWKRGLLLRGIQVRPKLL